MRVCRAFGNLVTYAHARELKLAGKLFWDTNCAIIFFFTHTSDLFSF